MLARHKFAEEALGAPIAGKQDNARRRRRPPDLNVFVVRNNLCRWRADDFDFTGGMISLLSAAQSHRQMGDCDASGTAVSLSGSAAGATPSSNRTLLWMAASVLPSLEIVCAP
jgi:hypothetical protein